MYNHSEPSALFLLDFVSRYAVDRCGAEDTFLVSILSVGAVLPCWVWVSSVTLMLVKVELYWAVARYTITLLTLMQMLLLLLYNEPAPVLACGSSQSYPCIQTALSSYGLSTFMCYDGLVHPKSQWLAVFMVGQLLFVAQAVLWLGFASATSALAGAMLGAIVACVLHVTLSSLSHDKSMLRRAVLWVENKLGIHTVDTLLNAPRAIHDSITADVEPSQTTAPSPPIAVNRFRMGANGDAIT